MIRCWVDMSAFTDASKTDSVITLTTDTIHGADVINHIFLKSILQSPDVFLHGRKLASASAIIASSVTFPPFGLDKITSALFTEILFQPMFIAVFINDKNIYS